MRKPSACSAQLLLLALVLVISAISAVAQNNKGAIVGTVKDPNDALVSKAQVKVTSAKTGEVRTTDTSDDGTYTVTPTKTGFTFSPTSRSVTIAGTSVTGVDFTATAIATFSVSGAGRPLAPLTRTRSAPAAARRTAEKSATTSGVA